MKEHPLRHSTGYHFNLQEFESSHIHFATHIPLIVADQGRSESDAEAIQVNPANDAYEDIVNTPACFMNSRVNKIKISEYYMIPKDIDEPDMMYQKAVITFGLGDADIVAADGTTLVSILKFTKGADNLMPTYTAGADLEHANLMPADIDTLDTTQSLEGVALAPDTLRTSRNGELGAKISSMVMGPRLNRVHKDFPYYSSRWFDVPPATRRMNAFCGCYLWVAVNPSLVDAATAAASDHFTPHFDDRLTIEEESLDCHILVEFNEYNDAFDQSP